MRKYTYEEVLRILKETEDAQIAFTDSDRERILSDETMREQLEKLSAYAEILRNEPTVSIPFSAFVRFEMDGDRTAFEAYYFRRRHKLAAFTILYWLYGREEDKTALEDIVWAILDEYTWCVNAHLRGKGLSVLQEDGYMIDLFAAETAEALAEMLSLVGEQLTPIVKMRVEHYLHERTLKYATDTFWWNNGCTNNWCAVCSGSVSMCALFVEKDVSRLAEILTFYIDVIEKDFFRGFADDGACLEGLSYWTYGFGYFTYFADLLKKRTKGQIDLFDDEKVKKIALFFGKCFFKGRGSVTFADAGMDSSYMPALAAYYSEMYPGEFKMPPKSYINMNYPQDHCARFALLLRNFTWASGKLNAGAQEPSGTHCLPVAQWYLSTATNGTAIAAKGGNNNEPHNHNDVGSFHIFKKGTMLLLDIGSAAYDRFYFSDKRYTYFATSSRSHNVPIINGTYQSAGVKKCAENVTLTEEGICMDIASAYALDTLDSLVRDIHFDREKGKTTLTDTYAFTETPERVVERFAFPNEPALGKGSVSVTQNGETLMLSFDPEVFTAELSFEVDLKHNTFGSANANGNVHIERKTYLLDLVVKNPEKEFSIKIEIE